jgi:uncharacterized RmlC-like cupin family protein
MPVNRWRGDAPAVAQESRATPTAVNNETYTLTVNGKSVSYTADASATVAEIVAGLVAAWNASEVAEHAEVTASDLTTYVKLLGDTAGVPFTVIGTATGIATLVISTPTAATGPNDAGKATNWSLGALPVAGDDIWFENSDVDVLYNLEALAAVPPASVNHAQTYTGKIGLPRWNAGGYLEYRPQYFKFLGGVLNVGLGQGQGSGRLKFDSGIDPVTVNVYDSGSGAETGIEAVLWKGDDPANVVNVTKGSFAAAPFAGEVSTILTLRVGYKTNVEGDAQVRLGAGVTLGTVEKTGGTLEINSAVGTALNNQAGETTINGTGAVTGLSVRGGRVYYSTTGTLGGNPVVSGPGILDFSRDARPKTVTNPIEKYGDEAEIHDPHKVINVGGNFIIDCNEVEDLGKLKLGRNVRITRAAVA